MLIATTPATFTRPADTTAYAANDLVANSTTAGSVSTMSWSFPSSAKLSRALVTKSTDVATNATFVLWLFGSAPTVSNGDNGAFAPVVTSATKFITKVTLDASVNFTIGGASALIDPPIAIPGTVYGLLSVTAAYAPGNAEVFTVTLFGET